MKRALLSMLVVVSALMPALSCFGQTDWATWRGPMGNGIAPGPQKPPTEWSAQKNIIWKAKVPGKGHASPTIVGNKIYLATADNQKEIQSVVCFDRVTGKQLWNKEVSRGDFNPRIYNTNTHASSSVASDGKNLFVVFNNNDNIQITAMDLDGKIVWQKAAARFDQRFPFGYGASPILNGDSVMVTSESKTNSGIFGFNRKTGKPTIRIERPKSSSYSSPVIAEVAGKKQLLISGQRSVTSYDPETGKQNWSTPCRWDVTCGTMVWNDELVFASGGYPVPYTVAIKADGSGTKVWENNQKCYEQSMIVVGDYLYGLTDNGVCYCWAAADGKEMWKGRMQGPVSASPVLAGGNLYFTSEKGSTFVVKPDPDSFQLLATNKLGDSTYGTPSIVDGKIYTRVAIFEGSTRQEYLYCIGSK